MAVRDGSDPAATARQAEELGFDFVSTWDHLHGTQPGYETWTGLTWAAAATSRIGLLTNVLGIPYRSPAVLAKMAETLDRLSEGRLLLGVGAGGSNEEFRAFGLPERTPGEKLAALEEAMTIIRGVWREPEFTFEGEHYEVHEANLEPKPARQIPIWFGTYGKRALVLTGRLADGWIPSMPYAPPEVIPAMRARIEEGAADAGRDLDEFTFAYNVRVRLGEAPAGAPSISGSPEEVAEAFRGLADLGFSAFNIWIGERPEQRERFAKEVLPLLS
jgi:probable F420-dependent oxidoreductase